MIVPGMHPREDWQDPAQPVTGPPPRGVPHTWVIHYPGGGGAPVGGQVPSYLRGIQNNYVSSSSRGYSIGYSYGVAQDGSMWEIRGDTYNPASNPGRKVEGNFNDVSRSIFVMVAGQDEGSPAAVESINAIIATQPDWSVISHGDVDFTSCCGDGMIAQIRAGIIGQQDNPTPPPEPEELIMIAYIGMPPAGTPNNPPWLLCVNGSVRYATNVDTAHATANGWAFVELNAEQYPLLLKGAGLA